MKLPLWMYNIDVMHDHVIGVAPMHVQATVL